jgi:hypothetical protein
MERVLSRVNGVLQNVYFVIPLPGSPTMQGQPYALTVVVLDKARARVGGDFSTSIKYGNISPSRSSGRWLRRSIFWRFESLLDRIVAALDDLNRLAKGKVPCP